MKVTQLSAAMAVALGLCAAVGAVTRPHNAEQTRQGRAGDAAVESIVARAVRAAHAQHKIPLCITNGAISLCLAPGTTPEYARAVRRRLPTDNISRYYADGRWYSTALNGLTGLRGDPITLTYSFVPDGVMISGYVGEPASPSSLFATMNTQFGGNTALWKAKFAECFTRWSQVSGVRYVEVSDDGNQFPAARGSSATGSVRGDVRISAHPIDGQWGILAYNFFPNTGDMVLDSAEIWGDTSNDYRLFRNTVMHEHGHGLGQAHVESNNADILMKPILGLSFDGPQDDDIRGGQRNYGDPYENNDTPATASALTLTNNTVTVQNLSLDGSADEDWFAIDIPAGSTLSATVTPVGSAYNTGRQGSTTQTSLDTRRVNALDLTVLSSNAATVLARANSQPAGEPQTVTGVAVPERRVYLKVANAYGAVDDIQRYTITITIQASERSLSGIVRLLGVPNSARPVTFTLRPLAGGANVVRTVTPAADGSFNLPDIPAALYDVFAASSHHLTRASRAVDILSASVSNLALALPPGDINGDDAVDFADFDLFLGFFGLNSGQSGFDTRADFNEDGTCDFTDFELLLNSFGINGDR